MFSGDEVVVGAILSTAAPHQATRIQNRNNRRSEPISREHDTSDPWPYLMGSGLCIDQRDLIAFVLY